jgi:hypothetical protein
MHLDAVAAEFRKANGIREGCAESGHHGRCRSGISARGPGLDDADGELGIEPARLALVISGEFGGRRRNSAGEREGKGERGTG